MYSTDKSDEKFGAVEKVIEHVDSRDSPAEHLQDAQAATLKEKELSVRDALRLYPKGIAFSLIFSTAIIMEGYDLSLVGSFLGFPPFQKAYGQPVGDGTYEIPAQWQTGIQNGVQIGSIIGLWLNGIISERFGYKKTMIGALISMIAFIFMPFFAQNIETILAGEILCGLPWGVFQTLALSYASDVAPVSLRPILTTYVNLCWVFGQFVAAGVLRGFLSQTGQWAYRVPFAIQWIWPPLILIGVVLAPESPWWLVRHKRYDEARKSLLALTRRDCGVPFDVDQQIALYKATDEMECQVSTGTSYLDCFRGTDLRRTEIVCMVWLAQAWCGTVLIGYSVQFYQHAGLSTENSFNFNLGQYAMGAVGTMLSWTLMPRVGRRTLYLVGLSILAALLIITGIMGVIPESRTSSLVAGSMVLLFTFVYDLTVGPVCYSLVAELPSTRLKIKSIALARNVYNIGGIINNAVVPPMLLASRWNLGAKSAFVWVVVCLILLVYYYFRLPEPMGRTYAELDALFERRIPARKFATTKVNEFTEDHAGYVAAERRASVAAERRASVAAMAS